jgi:hypothetical protein
VGGFYADNSIKMPFEAFQSLKDPIKVPLFKLLQACELHIRALLSLATVKIVIQ